MSDLFKLSSSDLTEPSLPAFESALASSLLSKSAPAEFFSSSRLPTDTCVSELSGSLPSDVLISVLSSGFSVPSVAVFTISALFFEPDLPDFFLDLPDFFGCSLSSCVLPSALSSLAFSAAFTSAFSSLSLSETASSALTSVFSVSSGTAFTTSTSASVLTSELDLTVLSVLEADFCSTALIVSAMAVSCATFCASIFLVLFPLCKSSPSMASLASDASISASGLGEWA